MPAEPEMIFCHTCQRNQMLLNKTLAEYLPDEDDPEYDKYASSLDAYRNELEDRYPQVCENCLPRVQDQIRAAGYAAKADNLRRMIDRSREHSRTVQTSRQTWTLRLIALAKWVYVSSVVVAFVWHAMGLTMVLEDGMDASEDISWSRCLQQAFSLGRAEEGCVLSPFALKLVQYSLVADLLTIWWNPKLASKTNSITGRMRGLKSLWTIRVIALALRTTGFLYWKDTSIYTSDLRDFHNTQLVLLVAITLSFALSWRIVDIVYTPVALPEETYIPSVPNSPQRPKSSYKPAHPETSTFDTMAQGFTSSFQVESGSALPPSPTLTATSSMSHYTEFTTPARKGSLYQLQDDSMDWTPTTRRFAPQASEILPPQFGRSPVQPQPASPGLQRRQEPVSLFSKPDPNPFRHKVPAAPKAPAEKVVDPWKRAPWQPPLKETTPNFFRTERQTRSQTKANGTASTAGSTFGGSDAGSTMDGGSVNGERDRGLEGFGVPKNVQRDAELFASPKLKYDYYGTMKDTGLEETFNGLFSK